MDKPSRREGRSTWQLIDDLVVRAQRWVQQATTWPGSPSSPASLAPPPPTQKNAGSRDWGSPPPREIFTDSNEEKIVRKAGDGDYRLILRDQRTANYVELHFDYFGSFDTVARELKQAWIKAYRKLP